MKKFKLFTLLFVAIGFGFTACDDDDSGEPDAGVTITGIPATAKIENLGTLGPVTATLTAPDGLASFSITKDGAAFGEERTFDGETTATVEFTYTAEEADADKNIVFVFTATDVDGDEETVTHVLSVGEAPPVSQTIVVTEAITGEVTWTKNNIYVLGDRIIVEDGGILNIEAGTIIKGQAGSGANSTVLVIARGGQIFAEGTAEEPIIFTSIADEIQPGMIASPNLDPDTDGLWGGVIILGRAPVSVPDGVKQIEGIPPSDTRGLYGGDNTEDNSGIFKYVSIRHGGTNIGEGNEINGLTLGGVGSGTIIENIEIIANQDDGIEPFGGSVNVKNLLVWNSFDDSFDCDQDYTGTIDNFIGILGADSDHALELDGPEGALNEGGFTLINGSIKGSLDATGGEYADLRDGVATKLENIYFFNFRANSDFELDNDKDEETGVSNGKTLASWNDGNIILSNLQFNVSHLESGNRTIDAIFNDTNDDSDVFAGLTEQQAKIVTEPTVGADKSVFTGWTWAAEAGELSDF
ncbi:hypothetical protein [Marivirga lumbricoides]